LKISVTVTLKKDILDPQGKVILQTLNGMGMENLKSLRQGKYFELELDETSEEKGIKQIDDVCKRLLVNLIIENYKIDVLK
tara:strand:- start:2180 stop:2422 length:243 start_codon:yes stop_codon:yes gene_type:complete